MLLSANIGFLAIQSVDSENSATARSVAQLASYTSGLLTLADLAIILILLSRHQRGVFDSAERGVCLHLLDIRSSDCNHALCSKLERLAGMNPISGLQLLALKFR